jgi:hypothetical protein
MTNSPVPRSHPEPFMMPVRKNNPRVEYRLRQNQRIKDSVSLGEKFPKLKGLTVDLAYFDSEGITKSGEMKYKVNVQHAKSMFCFVCQNAECIGGDFDLSEALAKAVAGRQKLATGEMRCQGSRRKANQNVVPCQTLLRYKLTLSY